MAAPFIETWDGVNHNIETTGWGQRKSDVLHSRWMMQVPGRCLCYYSKERLQQYYFSFPAPEHADQPFCANKDI